MIVFFKLQKFLIILFIFISYVENANATHAMGADITYQEIDTNLGRHRFTLTLCRDCSEILYSSEVLKVKTSTINATISLSASPRKTDLPLYFYEQDLTTCDEKVK